MLWVIIGIVIIILIFVCVFIFANNKFNLAVIKIDKAEEDIDIYLQKKSELLDRTRPLIKKELKLDKTMTALDVVKEDETNFETHIRLKKAYNEFFKTLDENEENIIGAIKFYNDTVVEYNQLVVTFTSKVIAFFKKYKKLDFYNNEKREIFEILNKK